MSSSIWTQCAGTSEPASLRLAPWRVVEAQHRTSTRKLVRMDAEQRVLEALIEGVKPPDATGGRLHYLLATPFRYPPLPHGSRFGGRRERGIWYGSETQAAAFAEVAYYRFLFLAGTAADLGGVATQLTAFRATVETARSVDLTAGCFAEHRAAIASPTSYRSSQALGADARAAGVEVLRYPSARDPEGGVNVAVLAPSAFGRRRPHGFETWHCVATVERVEARRLDYFRPGLFAFERSVFLVRGELPAPAF
ncbi:MAG TPA: RES family NAD+ phosphorylase [Longimicrobiales bacterium]|nr:RES family NAD+ phosphorylase [Longimicrobiales bacterium]